MTFVNQMLPQILANSVFFEELIPHSPVELPCLIGSCSVAVPHHYCSLGKQRPDAAWFYNTRGFCLPPKLQEQRVPPNGGRWMCDAQRGGEESAHGHEAMAQVDLYMVEPSGIPGPSLPVAQLEGGLQIFTLLG